MLFRSPNAPEGAKPQLGPDGKPLPPTPTVPVTPKPLPAKHPDRFSPGGEPETPASGADSGSKDNAAPEDEPAKPKPLSPKPVNPKPSTPKPANPNQPAPNGGHAPGRAQ